MSVQKHLTAIQTAAKELREKVEPNTAASAIADAIAFLDDLKTKNSELFAKKPSGSASTYAELLANSKAMSNPVYKLANLGELLRDLKGEGIGGRRRRTQRRKRLSSKVRKSRKA